ncbi:hypothetical protein ANN_15590 [Periplaneta americana]|uniref:Uncharacterized protein n=1 Tax=Periplaneta americana TaxID=6978 RepID=A0ABQ8SGR9_PERAM|nr:hypothetical protein ANN_15590 [Periplaneta americana]
MDSNRCRHCFNEIETLAHVLGSCPYGETLRNARHHKIRSAISQALRDKEYTTYEKSMVYRKQEAFAYENMLQIIELFRITFQHKVRRTYKIVRFVTTILRDASSTEYITPCGRFPTLPFNCGYGDIEPPPLFSATYTEHRTHIHQRHLHQYRVGYNKFGITLSNEL